MTKHHTRSNSPIRAQNSGRTLEGFANEIGEVPSRLSTIQLEKVSASPPALKLPPLFSLTPNSSGKGGNMQKRHTLAQTNQMENMSERKSLDQPLLNSDIDNSTQDNDNSYVQNLKRSVREAALFMQSCNLELSQVSHSDESSEHFFVPLSATGFSHLSPDNKLGARSNRLSVSRPDPSLIENRAPGGHVGSKYAEFSNVLNYWDSLHEYDRVNGFLSSTGSNCPVLDAKRSFCGMEEAQDQVFSPPLLMDTSMLADSYEDLLAPLSETETALMEN